MSSGLPAPQAQVLVSQPPKSDIADILPGEKLREDTEDVEVKNPRDVESSSVEGRESEESDADIMWVDWDGPNDPMNPKKYVFIHSQQA